METLPGGALRVSAVSQETATARCEWSFTVSAAAVTVESFTCRWRRHPRAEWETSVLREYRLSDSDKRELRALAGQALARSIRRVEFAGGGLCGAGGGVLQ